MNENKNSVSTLDIELKIYNVSILMPIIPHNLELA